MKRQKRLALLLAVAMALSVAVPLSAQAAEQTYVVQEDDVLWRIAQRYGTTYQELASYNSIANPHLIHVGQTIRIPDPAASPSEPIEDPGHAEPPELPQPPTEPIDDGGVTISILHTNDVHGRLVQDDTSIGMAAIKAIADAKRVENPNTILLDVGDALHGKILTNLNKGMAAARIMSLVGYQYFVPGNHDFNYGTDRLIELDAAASFETLAANLVRKDGGANPFQPYAVREVAGVKVVFVGLCTPETLVKTHPDNVKDYNFVNPVDCMKALLPEVQAAGDVIVVMAHLGDIDAYAAQLLAEAVPEIDVIIDGHSHSVYENKFVNGVLLAQTGEYDARLGVVDLVVKDGAVVAKTASFITREQAAAYEQDPAVLALVAEIEAENGETTSQVVASIDVTLNAERQDVRTSETNMGNLAAEALLAAYADADVAMINGGNLRMTLEPGDVTMGDVMEVMPYDNYQMVKKVSGATLLQFLEHGLASLPEQFGGFPQIAGMTVTYDSSKEVGSRVVEVFIGGLALDAAKEYNLVVNNFLAAGGDGYDMLADCETVVELSTDTEIFIAFLQSGGIAKAVVDGRLKDVAASATQEAA